MKELNRDYKVGEGPRYYGRDGHERRSGVK